MIPRLGFVGVGWIGRNRMEAVAASGSAEVVAVADVSVDAAARAADAVGAEVQPIDSILDNTLGLDGVVIATPSALHAEQAGRALAAGCAVFCQKPLARNAAECATVVDEARERDLLLGVDLSYRHLAGVSRMRQLIDSGALGAVYAADLEFHNAYGPDKAWFLDFERSGGGCVIDLGIHLVDLALWALGWPKVDAVTSRLFAHGRPLGPGDRAVEDYANARLDLSTGATVSLSCSWFLHAGRDAAIRAAFYGTEGCVELRNIGGSFFDFEAALHRGTSREVIAAPPDDWGPRSILAWVDRLASGSGFDPEAQDLVSTAEALDRIYGR